MAAEPTAGFGRARILFSRASGARQRRTAEGPWAGMAEGPWAGMAEGPWAGMAEGPWAGMAEGPWAGRAERVTDRDGRGGWERDVGGGWERDVGGGWERDDRGVVIGTRRHVIMQHPVDRLEAPWKNHEIALGKEDEIDVRAKKKTSGARGTCWRRCGS